MLTDSSLPGCNGLVVGKGSQHAQGDDVIRAVLQAKCSLAGGISRTHNSLTLCHSMWTDLSYWKELIPVADERTQLFIQTPPLIEAVPKERPPRELDISFGHVAAPTG